MLSPKIDTVITPERIELPPVVVFQLLGSWQDYLWLQTQVNDRTIPRIKSCSDKILEHFCHLSVDRKVF
jgi:hypothetical protein